MVIKWLKSEMFVMWIAIIVVGLGSLSIIFSMIGFGLNSLVNGSVALGLAIVMAGFSLLVTQFNKINMEEIKETLNDIKRELGKNNEPLPEKINNPEAEKLSLQKNRDLLNIAIGALLAILGNFWITSLKEISPSVQWGNPIILIVTTVCFWGMIIVIIRGIFSSNK